MRALPLGAAAAATLAAAAQGQAPPGKFAPDTHLVAQSVLSQDMGRCVVRQDRRRAIATVLMRSGDPVQRAAVDGLKPALVRCLNGAHSATLDAAYLRGGVAEALLDENGRTLLDAAARLPAQPPLRLSGAGPEPVVAIMGCAAAAQPADAAALLASPAGTPAEAAAFRTLIPSLQACAPATGEIRFSPARMRPATAIAVYRRVAAR